MMPLQTVEDLEIDLLLEAIYRCFGHDFRGYQRAPLQARLLDSMCAAGVATISALQDRVLHDEGAARALLRMLASRHLPLFDDPGYFRSLRAAVVPWLRSCPSARLWVAECGSAEEACALAILLAEEGLLERSRIFATMENDLQLQEAGHGAFAPERVPDYTRNYLASGGKRDFSDYFGMENDRARFSRHLLDSITWAQYSLVSDASFNEFEMIVCRQAMSAFATPLRRRALRLFYDSMPVFGILSVGSKENIELATLGSCFQAISPEQGLYRRIA